jgi:hypothetical protein
MDLCQVPGALKIPILNWYLINMALNLIHYVRWLLCEETISDSFSGSCLVFGLFRSRPGLQFHSGRFHYVSK